MSQPTAEDVLEFWFRSVKEPSPQYDLWFKKSDATDELIRDKFEPLVRTLASGHAYDWSATGPLNALAAIIALDQFSRNIYRNTPQSFANDPLALALTNELILFGKDKELHPLHRWFLYMPLEHSEDMDEQRASLAAFKGLMDDAPSDGRGLYEDAYKYAVKHAEVIERFGRFPHRNSILNRKTTLEEEAYLEEHGGF